MARKSKEDADRTRASLLKAALQLFLRQGVSRTTLNDIANGANVTRGAVYWHFENKDAIIIALYENSAGPLLDEMKASLKALQGPDVALQFRTIIQRAIKRIVEEPGAGQAMHIIMHSVEITEVQTPLRDYLDRQRQSMFALFFSALQELRNAGALASDLPLDVLTGAFMSYIYGLIKNHLESDDIVDLQRDYLALIDLFLQSILIFDPDDVLQN